jgi:hypothetical protein
MTPGDIGGEVIEIGSGSVTLSPQGGFAGEAGRGAG